MHTSFKQPLRVGLVLLALLLGHGVEAQPTVAPVTPLPTPSPTMSPTPPPTVAPTTPMPVPVPVTPPPVTPPPTPPPTVPPVTPMPVIVPTTPAPTPSPTEMPTPPPSTPAPVVPETLAPSSAAPVVTTAVPSFRPSVNPITDIPTGSPSVNPSGPPTSTPSLAPTGPLTEVPSTPPSLGPTMEATELPSLAPSSAPSSSLTNATFPDLAFTFTGIPPMSDAAVLVWQRATADYFVATYEDNANFGFRDVETSYFFRAQEPPATRRRLQDEANTLIVTFDQAVSYRNEGSDLEASEMIQLPFATEALQNRYVNALKATGHPGLIDVESVSSLSNAPAPPAETPEGDGGGGLSTGAIIGIAVGGAAGVALIAAGAYYFMGNRGGVGGGYQKDIDDTPPDQLQLDSGADEISTLDAGTKGQESIAGYGDQSVATVDYDYSKAYGGGADTSVSSAGGTFGSQTQGTASDELNAAGAALGASYDDSSYDAQYGASTSVREALFDVYAPAGKLGVVIDTPDDGAPVVHAIKDSSVIADKLQVGDKLVAVDDEDVRSMTAIKVSKLISRKSANPSRKLTIIRTAVVE